MIRSGCSKTLVRNPSSIATRCCNKVRASHFDFLAFGLDPERRRGAAGDGERERERPTPSLGLSSDDPSRFCVQGITMPHTWE